ncbi:FG-GAP repeat domain-containing protein [Maribellus maritimus]|uniref:FG-GAP repeat domain-containing protein n=1 Tax=Maribellus maritimus TaxID=2870838 RepID=UPI001EEC559A|nr:VCBS repeat-containing protein [Maribellus maritimus]MCG6189340.1 VCBS repeat-containing protein [Maribellus maritimus]
MKFWGTLIFVSIFISGIAQNNPEDLVRIKYNNPGLITDLGVGLWAWPFPMDFDKDGDLDLLVNCPDKPFNGIWFFENKTGGSNPVFKTPVKLTESKRNLQISNVNGEHKVMLPGVAFPDFFNSYFEKPDTLFKESFYQSIIQKPRFNLWRYVDFEKDGDLDFVIAVDDWQEYGWDNAFNDKGEWTNGPLHGTVYLVEQGRRGKYEAPKPVLADGKIIDTYGISGANFEDFDGDGDLDIITAEFVDRLSWFENIGTRKKPEYAAGKFIKVNGEVLHLDLEMVVPSAIDWDGNGTIDLIVGEEDGRVVFLKNTGKKDTDGPIFEPPVYVQQEQQYLKFGALVTPYSVDWDADGDEDLICGNTAGYIGFIENLGGGETPKWAKPVYLKADGETILIQAGENGSIQGPAERKWGYTTLSVADWNDDGLLDIIYNSIWGKVAWFENIGTKGNPRLAASKPVEVEWNGTNPKPSWNWWSPRGKNLATQWRTTPLAYDWNGDGWMDLLMLDHEGYLAFWERYFENGQLKLKPGKRIFTGKSSEFTRYFSNDDKGLLRLNTREAGSSGRRKFCVVDWDRDGRLDFLVNSDNVNFLRNIGEKDGLIILEDMGTLSEMDLAGHTTSPTTMDWDKNGTPDLLIGAEDGHFYYMKNKND